MAAAVTKVRAYGVEAEEAVNKRYIQRLILTITGLAADVDMDIGDYLNGSLGTFWTAAGGSATGAVALKALQDIGRRADFMSILGDVSGYARGAAAAAGVYAVTMANKAPNIAFNTAQAPTSLQLVIEWVLKDAEEPVEVYAAA